MLRVTLSLVAGVALLGVVSCVKCPDGKRICPGKETCCRATTGYNCCPYPDAVCCSDMLHCCPSGYTCNLATQMCETRNLPWFNTPMVMEEAEKSSALVLPASSPREFEDNHVPAEEKSSTVYCDNYYQCPDGTTCCKIPGGTWSCCLYSSGNCCPDGLHCCPMGYHCDSTSTHCIMQGLRYPFLARERPSVFQAALIAAPEERHMLLEPKPLTLLTEISNQIQEAGGVKCDSTFSCPEEMTCCKGPQGQWGCCPYRLGQCCADGHHCCQYGYTCSSSSLSCKKSI